MQGVLFPSLVHVGALPLENFSELHVCYTSNQNNQKAGLRDRVLGAPPRRFSGPGCRKMQEAPGRRRVAPPHRESSIPGKSQLLCLSEPQFLSVKME